MQLVAATANPGKLAEIEAILGDAVELLPRPHDVPEVVEDAPTLEGNARLKATAIARATSMPAVADDTGLEVDALGGAPGVRSARYAGEAGIARDNMAKLLGALAEVGAVEQAQRKARFRTVAIVAWPDGSEVLVSGSVEGHVADAPRGEGGFGYDPIFVPADGDGSTFAEMTDVDKNAISHRGRAFRALQQLLAGR